jgi:L-iditol 2-dehydrogenase
MSTGAITVKPLISATSSLEQASDWFRRLHNREAGLLKVVVTPNRRAEATT